MKTQDTQQTAQHTPGPWSNEYPFIKAGSAPIARIDCTPEMDKYDEANARLIASAPELLRALENLTEKVRLAHGYGQITADFSADYNAALAAIARATR